LSALIFVEKKLDGASFDLSRKLRFMFFFSIQKPVFQYIFDQKHLRNCDKSIYELKKPSKKLKSTRNHKSN
jgi:hypothetical protein